VNQQSLRFGLACAVASLAIGASAGDKKSLPAGPSRPFRVFVFTPYDGKDQHSLDRAGKNTTYEAERVRAVIAKKHKAWLVIAEKREGADFTLEIVSNDLESHANAAGGAYGQVDVARARLTGLGGMKDSPIIGQGLGNEQDDLANRLEQYCKDGYERLEAERSSGGGR